MATPASLLGSGAPSGDKVQKTEDLIGGLTASRWRCTTPPTTPQLTGKSQPQWGIKGQPLAAHFPSQQRAVRPRTDPHAPTVWGCSRLTPRLLCALSLCYAERTHSPLFHRDKGWHGPAGEKIRLVTERPFRSTRTPPKAVHRRPLSQRSAEVHARLPATHLFLRSRSQNSPCQNRLGRAPSDRCTMAASGVPRVRKLGLRWQGPRPEYCREFASASINESSVAYAVSPG